MRALKVRNRLLNKCEFIPLAVEASKVAVRSLNVAGRARGAGGLVGPSIFIVSACDSLGAATDHWELYSWPDFAE